MSFSKNKKPENLPFSSFLFLLKDKKYEGEYEAYIVSLVSTNDSLLFHTLLIIQKILGFIGDMPKSQYFLDYLFFIFAFLFII